MVESMAKITLDVQNASTCTTVSAKKGDTGRKIIISLADGGFPYEISADCYAVLTAVKPDGNILYNHCDIEGNTIVYVITEQTTAAAGRLQCEVKLYGAEDRLITSATFRLIVDGIIYGDDPVESQDEFSALTHLVSEASGVILAGNEMIADGQEMLNTAQQVIREAENARVGANQAAGDATAAAKSANTAAENAGTAAKNAATAATNASTAADSANEAAKRAQNALKTAEEAAQTAARTVQLAQAAAKDAQQAGTDANAAANRATAAAILAENASDAAWEANRKVDVLADTVSQLHSEENAIIETAEGALITLTDAANRELQGLKLCGRTVQNGIPASDAPIHPENLRESVKVTVCGKNLVDMHEAYISPISTNTQREISENRVRVYTTAAGAYKGARLPDMMLCAGVTYTLSASLSTFVNGTPRVGFRRVKATATQNANSFIGGTSVYPAAGVKESITFTLTEDVEAYLAILVTGDKAADGDATFADIQLELGPSATKYDPYNGNTLTATVSGGLPGVPVSSGGNYTDADGKHWICDEVDFEKGVYIQRVAKKVFDGTETLGETATNFAYNYPQFVIKPMKRTWPIVSHATNIEINFNGNLLLTRTLFTDFGVTDKETFKAWLAQRYAAGAPLTVVYQREEEIHTPLSEIDPDALVQFAALRSSYPNTTVFNDAGAYMKLSYVADPKCYIDKKFNQLAQAMLDV